MALSLAVPCNVQRHCIVRKRKTRLWPLGRGGGKFPHLGSAKGENLPTCFIDLLRQYRVATNSADPWLEILQAVRGRKGADGVERVSTGDLYDALNLQPFQRTPEAGKRIKTLMQTLGWTPIRARLITCRGNFARVRGYACQRTNTDRQKR